MPLRYRARVRRSEMPRSNNDYGVWDAQENKWVVEFVTMSNAKGIAKKMNKNT